MNVTFSSIAVGSKWTRQELAARWDCEAYQAIARGVVTPRDSRFIILFVQEDKPEGFTPYENRLDGRKLHWEGEQKHGNDIRIANAEKAGDEIHIFHREQHRNPFTYLGRARLIRFEHRTNAPSQAEFEVAD